MPAGDRIGKEDPPPGLHVNHELPLSHLLHQGIVIDPLQVHSDTDLLQAFGHHLMDASRRIRTIFNGELKGLSGGLVNTDSVVVSPGVSSTIE